MEIISCYLFAGKYFFCPRSTAHGRGKASSALEAPPTVVESTSSALEAPPTVVESTSFAQEAPSTVGKVLLLLKKHRPRSGKRFLLFIERNNG